MISASGMKELKVLQEEEWLFICEFREQFLDILKIGYWNIDIVWKNVQL